LAVLVIDKHKKPLMPCTPKRARQMLERGRAVVHRKYPFTIRIKDRIGGEMQDICVKIDPGSRKTGIALVREGSGNKPVKVLCLFELEHRGKDISEALTKRRGYRRRRRNANLRYRAPRFDNRCRSERKGWLAPSLRHRINSTMSWVSRLRKVCPITGAAVERVRFDMQVLENAEISGVGYQQGTLAGYELWEYLLERDGRHCTYCGNADVPLTRDHVIPRARGGSNRPSNLVLACKDCNTRKDATPVEEFAKPEVLAHIKAQLKRPLKDAAAVNATRWALWEALQDTGLPIEASSGGRTKFNRTRLGIPKTHALDAVGVGEVEAIAPGWEKAHTLEIKAAGRGTYARTKPDTHGFPRIYFGPKFANGFQTGDIVRAEVLKGKHAGTHVGRVAIRQKGGFRVGNADGINWKHCRIVQRADGYGYRRNAAPRREGRRIMGVFDESDGVDGRTARRERRRPVGANGLPHPADASL
jgi:hypothetical protein